MGGLLSLNQRRCAAIHRLEAERMPVRRRRLSERVKRNFVRFAGQGHARNARVAQNLHLAAAGEKTRTMTLSALWASRSFFRAFKKRRRTAARSRRSRDISLKNAARFPPAFFNDLSSARSRRSRDISLKTRRAFLPRFSAKRLVPLPLHRMQQHFERAE